MCATVPLGTFIFFLVFGSHVVFAQRECVLVNAVNAGGSYASERRWEIKSPRGTILASGKGGGGSRGDTPRNGPTSGAQGGGRGITRVATPHPRCRSVSFGPSHANPSFSDGFVGKYGFEPTDGVGVVFFGLEIVGDEILMAVAVEIVGADAMGSKELVAK